MIIVAGMGGGGRSRATTPFFAILLVALIKEVCSPGMETSHGYGGCTSGEQLCSPLLENAL